MEFLNASNNAETQLISNMSATDTTCTVRDSSIFPKPPFLISINDEIIKVNAVTGNTFGGLERGQENTTPSEHNIGSFVENRFTAGMYHNIVDNIVDITNRPKTVSTSSYDNIISLPNSATNGQVSVNVEGNTETDEEGNTKSTVGSMRVKSVGKNLINNNKWIVNKKTEMVKDNSEQLIHIKNGCSTHNVDDILSKKYNIPYQIVSVKPNTNYFISFTGKKGSHVARIKIFGVNSKVCLWKREIQDEKVTTMSDSFNTRNNTSILLPLLVGTSASGHAYFGKIMLSEHDSCYEPYKESRAYIVAKKDNKIVNLNSLPNGVRDEIRPDGKGGYELIKRTKEVSIGNARYDSYWENSGLAVIKQQTSIKDSATFRDNAIAYNDIHQFKHASTVVDKPFQVVMDSQHRLFISFSLEEYETLGYTKDDAGAKQYIQDHPTKLIYQLAKPEIIPVRFTGLQGYENGKVYFDTVIPELGFYYNNGLETHSPEHPIKEVDTLYKVDKETGLRTPLDTSKCEIRSDRLSFSHPDLQDGDLCDWDYIPVTESTPCKKTIVAPTNISAAVSSLLKDSQIQKENIRQVNSKVDAHKAETENILENQLSVLNFERFVNNDDWSDALIVAHDALPSDGGVIVVPSPIKIKKPVVFEKRVYLKGIGFSHSPDRSPSSTILKDGDFTGLTFLGHNSFIENIDIDGVTGNGGDGINIVGSRIGMRNVSVRNQGGHGIRVGGSKGDNTNGWNFTNLFTVGNGLDGLHIHHGEEGNSDPPNVNAGILVGIDTRINGRDGIHLGNTMQNTFLGVMSQHNGRYGVYVGDNARGNHFFNAYTELNMAGHTEEFYLAPGSMQNYVYGQRSRLAYNSIEDEGHFNYILTTNPQISGNPYFLESGLYTSGVTIANKTLSGQWQFENKVGRSLYLDLIGTSAVADFVLGNTERLLGFKVGNLVIGIGGKQIKGLYVDSRTIDIGTIPPNSSKEFSIPVAEATSASTVSVTPRTTIADGVLWSSYVKTSGTVNLRIANITTQSIHVGELPFKTTVVNTAL